MTSAIIFFTLLEDRCDWPKILKPGVVFGQIFLKQVVIEIQNMEHPHQKFSKYPPPWVAKLEAYGSDTKTLKLILSYLNGCKQCLKIRNSFSLLKLILFDIPHRSILKSIFFNILMNDIFFLLGSDLHNFADNNTVTAVAETVQDLINSIEVKTSDIING